MEDRPARRQVTEVVTTHASSHDMMTYNIWSHRGNRTTRREGRGKIIKSEYRCHSALDCGWTRGERAGTKFICIYFARGVCHHGSSCNYVHRVPGADFELYHRTQPQYDIFGRDRSLDIDASTKGAGSLNRDCTTLYLYLGALASLPDATVEKMVRDDFEEWGEIEEINIVSKKAVGFVRYILRSASEFAKAAMHQQQLRGDTTTGTVLDIRWAHDDPNPVAIARVKEKQEKMLADAYMAAIERLPDGERAAKLQEIALSQAHTKDAVTSAYPNTSHQYNDNNNSTRGLVGEGESQENHHHHHHHGQEEEQEQQQQEEEGEDDISRYLSADELEDMDTTAPTKGTGDGDTKKRKVGRGYECHHAAAGGGRTEEESQDFLLGGILANYESE